MKNIAFISDLFLENYVGGAELTTDAIMSYATKRNYPITASHCKNITKDVIDKLNNDLKNTNSYIGILLSIFFTHRVIRLKKKAANTKLSLLIDLLF